MAGTIAIAPPTPPVTDTAILRLRPSDSMTSAGEACGRLRRIAAIRAVTNGCWVRIARSMPFSSTRACHPLGTVSGDGSVDTCFSATTMFFPIGRRTFILSFVEYPSDVGWTHAWIDLGNRRPPRGGPRPDHGGEHLRRQPRATRSPAPRLRPFPAGPRPDRRHRHRGGRSGAGRRRRLHGRGPRPTRPPRPV